MVSIDENEVFKKLETMNKANLDKVAIFVKWLIRRREPAKQRRKNGGHCSLLKNRMNEGEAAYERN